MNKYKKRHKIPLKKKGVKTTCNTCGNEIICKMSTYEEYDNQLQWQNYDGTAHYSIKWLRKFYCNIPKTDEEIFVVGTRANYMTSGNLDRMWD